MYHHVVDGLVKPSGRPDREINPPWADNDRETALPVLVGGQYIGVAKRTTLVGVRIGTCHPIGQPLEGEDLASVLPRFGDGLSTMPKEKAVPAGPSSCFLLVSSST